jgi:hypothetical protein
MPVYEVSFELVDAQNRKASKRFETQTLADFAAADTAASALLTDLVAITEGRVLSQIISERTVISDTVTAGANVDEGGTLVVRKEDNRLGVLKVPMPIAAIRNSDGTLDITNALVTAYTDNFKVAPTGSFTFSDGELITELVAGRLDK